MEEKKSAHSSSEAGMNYIGENGGLAMRWQPALGLRLREIRLESPYLVNSTTVQRVVPMCRRT